MWLAHKEKINKFCIEYKTYKILTQVKKIGIISFLHTHLVHPKKRFDLFLKVMLDLKGRNEEKHLKN